jgi:hypothetical protein
VNNPERALRNSLLVALCATALSFCWQFAMVHFDYGDNWTSLFYTGDARAHVPDELASEHIYRFPNVVGYDGQLYHLIAHDPLFRRNFAASLDMPRVRYRRILVPGLAALLSLGRDQWVDRAYFATILGFVFLGTFWLARWSAAHGRSAYWGFLFLATPAALSSVPLMVIDVSLAALTAGFIWYAEQKSPAKLFAVLACAVLARETGILLLAGWCGWLLYRREVTRAMSYATAAVPAACWAFFVTMHTKQPGPVWLSPIPLYGIFYTFGHPFHYPPGLMANLLLPLDRLGLIGMLVALAFVSRDALRPAIRDHKTFAALAFAALALFLSGGDVWPEVGAFGRNFTPLLLIVAISGIASHDWRRFIPLLLIDPRISIMYATQAERIVRGILHR